MGQVFTWGAVGNREVPRREHFAVVSGDVRKAFEGETSVAAALIFGSVLRGDGNLRSDLDVLVIYETKEEAAALKMMHTLDLTARTLYVPINFTPCDTVLARTRLHHLGVSFLRHLQSSIDAGGLVKGDLTSLLAPTIPAMLEIESYIKMKMYNMQESLAQMATFSEERMAAFLKKALEAPMHVARKMLIYEDKLGGDSKREVRERYREVMPGRLSQLFDHLVSIDTRYTSELEAQLAGPDKMAYVETLGRIQSELRNLLEFLRLNILRLNDVR